MQAVTRRIVFESNDFRIGHVVARPSSAERGEVECQNENVLVLPLTGVFAKHESRRRHVVVTPNDAGLIAAGRPYRISYPAGIGDKCLTLRFSNDVVRKVLPQVAMPRGPGSPHLASSAVLPPETMLARSLLCHRLAVGHRDPLEIEELSSSLLASTLRVMLRDGRDDRRHDVGRSVRAIEIVKEAISLDPERKWTLHDLAQLANFSPYHLAHIFRHKAGTPVYRFVVRTRLAKALDALLDTDAELAAIAYETGFASHSHFTTHFHDFFGLTPLELRRRKSRATVTKVRKIVIAHKTQHH
jgi:AraC family transcriptional regulator